MITTILRILGLPSPLALAIYAAVGAGLFASGFGSAWHVRTVMNEAAVTKAEEHVVTETHQQDAITETVEEKATERQIEIRTVTETLIKKVPVYVTKKADAKCPIPAGAVQLHDSAARHLPLVPIPAGKLDGGTAGVDDPSGILLSQILDTVAKNYGRYYEVRGQLLDLQGWIRQQQALSAKGRP